MKEILKVVVLCLAIQFCLGAPAETRKSGNIIEETWTKANSPCLIEDDILVAGLTIEPGVRVLFLSNYVFEIAGTLHANGTAQDPILFAPNDSAVPWNGIFFNYSGDQSELN